MKKSFAVTGGIYLAFIAALAVLNIFIKTSWFSYAYVAVMLTGIFLNNEKIKAGMLAFSAASLIYIYISYRTAFLGELILNGVFAVGYVIIFAVILRQKNFEIKKLQAKTYLWLIPAMAAAIPLYYLLLKEFGSQEPLLNSFSTVITVLAVVLTMYRALDQYLLWIAGNIVQIVLWSTTLGGAGTEYVFIIVFNVFFAVINVINLIKWYKSYRLSAIISDEKKV